MPDALDFRAVGQLAGFLGLALRRVRGRKGLTQKGLRSQANAAREAATGRPGGIGAGTLSDAENGVSNFEIATLEAFLEAMGASALDLLVEASKIAALDGEGVPIPHVGRVRVRAVISDTESAEGSLAALDRETHPVLAEIEAAIANRRDDSMLTRGDAITVLGFLKTFNDDQLRDLVTAAIEIRGGRRLAQPAPKESLHRP